MYLVMEIIEILCSFRQCYIYEFKRLLYSEHILRFASGYYKTYIKIRMKCYIDNHVFKCVLTLLFFTLYSFINV